MTNALEWIEDGLRRSGRQWGEARSDGSVWVLPDSPERHEECVLVLRGEWLATVYEDHTRGSIVILDPKRPTPAADHCPFSRAPYGCTPDDDEYDTCVPLCHPTCGFQLVRPGKTQCDECDAGYLDENDPREAGEAL